MLTFFKSVLTILTVLTGLPFLLWGAGFIIFTGSICSMHEPRHPQKTDAAIVLTGGTNRVSRGLELLASGTTKQLLVSGVHKDVTVKDILSLREKDAAPVGEKVLKETATCCITLGYEAGNTIGNAREAQEWLSQHDADTVTLITANYHMPRAVLEFRHFLPETTKIIPYPVQPEEFDPKEKIFWKTAFLEYHKFLMTALRIFAYPQETNPLPDALRK